MFTDILTCWSESPVTKLEKATSKRHQEKQYVSLGKWRAASAPAQCIA